MLLSYDCMEGEREICILSDQHTLLLLSRNWLWIGCLIMLPSLYIVTVTLSVNAIQCIKLCMEKKFHF